MKSFAVATLTLALSAGMALAQSGPQVQEMRAACKEDVEKLCSNVQPIEVQECLMEHIDEVSEGCKATVARVGEQDTMGHD
ncbi:cysteine rich repeat-containing protein [Amorphus orientalis]|uniref:Cysteine rich repeat-containing protein n=1 Tax=Amorphus orientalis TaxID=649198 RepID=A0AAE3VL83_9HYPH|nr:cysteine rich repeat-containing protein [Amorphus orientalis]MDQ0314075.1 hypothetical protein [Amorphus orientalis]